MLHARGGTSFYDILASEREWIPTFDRPTRGGGALQYQMGTGVRLTLPKAGAFGENTVSKYEGSLGEKPNFGSKIWGIG